MVRLFIKPLLEERFHVEVNAEDSVSSVKARIFDLLSQMNRHVPQTCDLVFRGNILEDHQKMNEFKDNDHCILLYKLDPTLPEISTLSPPVPQQPVEVEEPVVTDHTTEIELSDQHQMSGDEEIEDDEDEEFNGTGEDPSLESLVALLQGIQPDPDSQVPILVPNANVPAQPNQNPAEPPNTQAAPQVPAPDNVANYPVPGEPVPPNDPNASQAFRINFSQILRLIPFPEQDLAMLMGIGFPEWRCRKALLLNFFDADMALEWLLNHSNDPHADDPFSEEEAASIIGALNNIRYESEDTNNIEEQIAQCVKNNKCTFTVTKREFAPQKWYYCYTCGLVDSEGVCESCAAVCHKNHKLSAVRSSKKFYCDCGAGAYDCKCNTE
jgi:hypothetical protein